ncbi:F0F1 ATP synthase subunit delta [Saliterribacillus persicus]|uniref:ATP synthase subunit delta n=1 Tax=Saliterribacillus persicus TaxID=930114 RepID=A0A368YAY9_9BACI|nr:F0F1 ATP synthase subunit delta [Saliterribacillus persicus]RCW77431.1 ATP synthase F1 subcomplex delta subunit [Saliterribacillus persicus]
MSKANVAKRYAEALFQIGKEKETLDHLEPELLTVKEVFESNDAFLKYLQHPQVELEKKKQLLRTAFDGFSSDVLNTLSLLVDRHNQAIVPEVIEHFITLKNELQKVAVATVYTVRELTEEEQVSLKKVFVQRLEVKEVKINQVIDSTVLGGVRIKIGNTVYDGTLKGKLDRLERQIVTAN